MKQSDDQEAFFKKYEFTSNYSLFHPVYKDRIHFDGLEADYVNYLERELEHYKKCFAEVSMNNERLLTREHYRLQDEIKKLKVEKHRPQAEEKG